jgi:hypothetical protein
MPIDFNRVPLRVEVPPPPQPSMIVWIVLLVLALGAGARLTITLWPAGRPTNTLWFWFCIVGYASAYGAQLIAAAARYTAGNLMVGLNYSNVQYTPGAGSRFTGEAVFNTYGAISTCRVTPVLTAAIGYSYTQASRPFDGGGTACRDSPASRHRPARVESKA